MGKRLPTLYCFEVFAFINAVAVHLILFANGVVIGLGAFLASAIGATPALAVSCLIGVLVRYSIDRWRRPDRGYALLLRSWSWWGDTLRLLLGAVIATHAYSFLKLFIPLINPRMYDRELATIDEAMFGGLNPSALFLNLFASSGFIAFIDWTYAWVFVATLFTFYGFLLSSPDREQRFRLLWGLILMWCVAAWIYLAIPSLGPIFMFEDIWKESGVAIPRSIMLQAKLMKNFAMVLEVPRGFVNPELNPIMGVAAFPSMHVGFHTYVFLSLRRTNKVFRFVFAALVALIALGSVITGWHYLIDAVGGALLAWGAYAFAQRYPREPFHGASAAEKPA